jgi:hypothetical protein
MCVSKQCCGTDGVDVKLPPVCDIDVRFTFISFDQEVCNSVPLVPHLFKEVARVTNALDEGSV